MINPKKCSHVWDFAYHLQKAGTLRPKDYIVLFCVKCGASKIIEIKV